MLTSYSLCGDSPTEAASVEKTGNVHDSKGKQAFPGNSVSWQLSCRQLHKVVYCLLPTMGRHYIGQPNRYISDLIEGKWDTENGIDFFPEHDNLVVQTTCTTCSAILVFFNLFSLRSRD